MAITSPQAIKFSNEKIRVAADRLAQAYNFANIVIDEWNSGASADFPNDGAEVLQDGADVDGRPIVDGAELHLLITRLTELQTDYEATSNAKLNTILAVAVNTSVS